MKKETPIPKDVKAKLISAIEKQEWRRAKTYEKIAPHEYFLESDNRSLFRLFKNTIYKYGVNELFRLSKKMSPYPCRYMYLGKYRYWVMENILNRAETKYIRYKDGVSYQVVKSKNKTE